MNGASPIRGPSQKLSVGALEQGVPPEHRRFLSQRHSGRRRGRRRSNWLCAGLREALGTLAAAGDLSRKETNSRRRSRSGLSVDPSAARSIFLAQQQTSFKISSMRPPKQPPKGCFKELLSAGGVGLCPPSMMTSDLGGPCAPPAAGCRCCGGFPRELVDVIIGAHDRDLTSCWAEMSWNWKNRGPQPVLVSWTTVRSLDAPRG